MVTISLDIEADDCKMASADNKTSFDNSRTAFEYWDALSDAEKSEIAQQAQKAQDATGRRTCYWRGSALNGVYEFTSTAKDPREICKGVCKARRFFDNPGQEVCVVEKETFTEAHKTICKLEDLFSEAEGLFNTIPPDIQQAILNYHNERGSVQCCLRWRLQAIKEIREDWHTVVAGMPCD